MADVIEGGATPWYSFPSLNYSAGQYPGGWLGVAGTGLGAASDLMGTLQRLQQYEAQQKQFQAQRRIAQTLADPTRLSAAANALYQGLSPAATDQVSRALNQNLALRGLGGGGGAADQFVADAFAKIEAERRGQALQGAIAGLGGGAAALGGAQYPAGLPVGQTAQMLHALAALRAAMKPKTAEAAAGGAADSGTASAAGQPGWYAPDSSWQGIVSMLSALPLRYGSPPADAPTWAPGQGGALGTSWGAGG